jgi:hypothetical protein
VLVDIVKLSQKKGMKGQMGDWKEFLNSHDKKFGAGMSDPSKRSHEVLAAFLKTFTKDDDLKVNHFSLYLYPFLKLIVLKMSLTHSLPVLSFLVI